jgi:hypothetical protein
MIVAESAIVSARMLSMTAHFAIMLQLLMTLC